MTIMIPDRAHSLLTSAMAADGVYFPRTELFNEGWMLRLVLDAVQRLDVRALPFRFAQGSCWYSEARLASPFGARRRADPLAEGFTNVDGVIGHFDFNPQSRAGLRITAHATQFVLEAKLFSNLSAGTKNAPKYNQAARNLACLSKALTMTGRRHESFAELGFFVLAPDASRRRPGCNIEECLDPEHILRAVRARITEYERQFRPEAPELIAWEDQHFKPLVARLVSTNSLGLVTWEQCIGKIGGVDPKSGQELAAFYDRSLSIGRAGLNPQTPGF